MLQRTLCYDPAMAQPGGPSIGSASVVVLGGINMDLVTVSRRAPEAGETVVGDRFLTYPGGKGANQAVAAARMGARVSMAGRVGGDSFGQELLGHLRSAGVDVAGIEVDAGTSSGIAVINIDSSTQNRIVQVLGANATCGPAEVSRAVAALEHASVLMLQLEVPLAASLAAARIAASMGRTVVLDPGPACPLPDEMYGYCSYITPNETEASALTGIPVDDEDGARRAAAALRERGAGSAVITLGERGALFDGPGGVQFVPAFRAGAVVETTGAGDAFNGAFAVALAEGRDPASAVRFGCAAAGISVTRPGTARSMPDRAEVEALMAEA